jgi:hypothetical protein
VKTIGEEASESDAQDESSENGDATDTVEE